jgi:segregation and condensation protein A
VVVTLLALLELLRESLVDLVQAKPFGPIHVRAVQTAAQVAAPAGDEAATR